MPFQIKVISLHRFPKESTDTMSGEMAEWSIAAVLKTVELRGSGGSNPSLSAIKGVNQAITRFTPFFAPKKQFEYFCNIVLPNYFSSLEFLSEFARNK